MRLGCCGSLDDAAAIREAGFDFLEVNAQTVLKGTLDDAAWSKDAPDPDRLPLPIEAANSLVPGDLPIVGPERDPEALRKYMANVAARAQRLGIARLSFGSAGARRRPEGVSPAAALVHLADFGEMAAEVACRHDIIVAVENLMRAEVNTINTLAEVRELVDRVGHRAFTALVDAYHFGVEGEPDEAVLQLANRIRHVHVAEVKGRIEPGGHGPGGGDGYDFEGFFCLLHKLGYDERVSVEAKWSKPVAEAGAATVAYLREAWRSASRCEV